MPWARQTLTQLRDGALQQIAASRIFDAETGEVVNPILLEFDPLTIMAKVMAGLAYEEFGYLDYIALQATPFTARDEMALAWGGMVGETIKAATQARASATFAALTTVPTIPAGTRLVRRDGVTYDTTADATVSSAGQIIFTFAATTPGAAGTIALGTEIVLANGVSGVSSPGLVTTVLAPGADQETEDQFRQRYLARFAAPAQGGSALDYVSWALAIPGVTRAWCVGNLMGAGTVGVYVMFDGSEGANNGFPVGTDGISPQDNQSRPRSGNIATGDQLLVANALLPLQPVTALVFVVAPGKTPIDFTISNLGTANTTTVRAAIAEAIKQLFVSQGDVRGTKIYANAWNAAIQAVPGVVNFTVTVPATPIFLVLGQLPVVGVVTCNN